MPVTRNRSSLGECNAQVGTSDSTAFELPLAKSREVRQAAMGSPYGPTTSKFKMAHLSPPSASRGQFGSVLPNGLPGGARTKFTRTESMPVIPSCSDASDSQEDSDLPSPIAARTRTATKQGPAATDGPALDQESSQDSTSSPSQRRTGAVKRSAAAASASSNTTSSNPTSQRSEDPRPGDDDDDEDDSRRRRRRSSRLGGCSSQSEQLHDRDDSNKENIAPFSYSSYNGSSHVEVVIPSPSRPLGARTRTMARRSVSSPVIQFSGNAANGSAPADSANPRRSSRRSGPTRTDSFNSSRRPTPLSTSSGAPSTPTTRRVRGALSSAVIEAGIPASPFARLNLASGPSAFGMAPSFSNNTSLADDAESSYFSSQGSGSVAPSIFDSTSQVADEDSDMDDLSLIPGLHGPRRSRTHGADGTQDSSVYSRDSSVMPEVEIVQEKESTGVSSAAAADQTTTAGESTALDVEMQDVDATLVEPVLAASLKKLRFPNVYAHARSLLRYSSATTADADGTGASKLEASDRDAREEVEIVGREREMVMIKTFLSTRFGNDALFPTTSAAEFITPTKDAAATDLNAPSLYMCGLPGTGKTALVRSILSELRQVSTTMEIPRIAFVNCMSITTPRLIFGKILEQLGEEPCEVGGSGNETEGALEMVVKKSDRHILIVLDEIDHLLEKRAHQSVLQRLFCIGKSEAAEANKSAKCAMIGIANSLDLTERFMPLLLHTGMSPALLHFQPFTADDIAKVVRSRLTGLHARYDYGPDEDSKPAQNTADAIFRKPALDLASKRIASATGDLRKALDVCRLAVELVESEQRQGAINVMTTEKTADKVVAAELLAPLTPETAPRVMPQHIVRVLNSVLGSPQISRVRQLDMHAKFFLLAYLVAERRQAENLPILGCGMDDKVVRAVGGTGTKPKNGLRFLDVGMTYSKILQNDGQFQPVTTSELLQVVENLEVVGVVTLSNEAGRAGKKVAQQQIGGANNRIVSLVLAQDDVRDGITTAGSSSFSASNEGSGSGAGAGAIAVVADAISRMWVKEDTRIMRSRGWEAAAMQSEAVRRAELGGGRGFQPIGL
ncbi:hypothetical protein A4X13_0g3247 [Tilletia indica]|uniref:AAA+ ATPase domain-containing protein n=1 Tax=Tilletia indica TaxID=43049 RepID=A0A177TLE4_9BASI|nr:hypothetical protein A4X13_0g3247 [Tilletia indica]